MKIDYIIKIESYNIRDSILTLHFDKDFKQIRYIKMESDNLLNNSNKTSESLDCDEMEISYSKRRKCFNICLSNTSDQVIILITQFDKRHTCYGYHIKRQGVNKAGDVKNDNQDLLAKGMISLFSGNFKDNQNDNQCIYNTDIFSIKNQNIFAKIKKKGANDGVATFM